MTRIRRFQPWKFSGRKTTIVKGLEQSNAELAQWYSRVIEFLLKVAESPDFEIENNGYNRYPGVLVTSGVKGYFRGKPFEIWSDMPGELILRHDAMGTHMARELIRRLKVLWEQK